MQTITIDLDDNVFHKLELEANQKGIDIKKYIEEEIAQNRINEIKGVPAKNLLKYVGSISKEDLLLMEKAIEEGCERIDVDEW